MAISEQEILNRELEVRESGQNLDIPSQSQSQTKNIPLENSRLVRGRLIFGNGLPTPEYPGIIKNEIRKEV
ncbi:MAG: hypothetical protein PHQ59_02080 [Candidatus Daviesbacteria bacterium]|nr:hypothetical protein [Candidatus Daviesbacteria bacterium]